MRHILIIMLLALAAAGTCHGQAKLQFRLQCGEGLKVETSPTSELRLGSFRAGEEKAVTDAHIDFVIRAKSSKKLRWRCTITPPEGIGLQCNYLSMEDKSGAQWINHGPAGSGTLRLDKNCESCMIRIQPELVTVRAGTKPKDYEITVALSAEYADE